MEKFDPFLSLDCTGWRAWGRNPRKGRDQILPSGNHANQAAGRGQNQNLSPELRSQIDDIVTAAQQILPQAPAQGPYSVLS